MASVNVSIHEVSTNLGTMYQVIVAIGEIHLSSLCFTTYNEAARTNVEISTLFSEKGFVINQNQ